MKFRSRVPETVAMIENVCLVLSLGAIFVQIWLLISAMEMLLKGNSGHLGAAVLLSGIALGCCGLTALTTLGPFSGGRKRGEAS